MAKRNHIAEILERKRRLYARLPRSKQALQRLKCIIGARDYLERKRGIEPKYKKEIMRHFPVALVGCMEGYFRLVVRDLFNAGPPFRERVGDLEKSEKIEFGLQSLLAVADRQLTPGDIVSHFLRINNLEDIDRIMSKLLACDFLHEVKTWKVSGKNSTIVLGELQPPVVPLLKKLFELRHIYCHELAVKEVVVTRQISDSISAGFLFIISTEDYIQGVHMPMK